MLVNVPIGNMFAAYPSQMLEVDYIGREEDRTLLGYEINYLAIHKKQLYKWPCKVHGHQPNQHYKRCNNSWILPNAVIKKLSRPIGFPNYKLTFIEIGPNSSYTRISSRPHCLIDQSIIE